MPMRNFLIVIAIFVLSSSAFGQKTKRRRNASPWADTTLIIVKLHDKINDNKIVAVEVGRKATIYVKLKPMRDEVKKDLSDDPINQDHKKIIRYFDSASLKGDTISVGEYLYLPGLAYLLSHQLIEGNAKIYYKKQQSFVDTIFHRLERYGGNADRFFYLPDKRPFFAVRELSGILDKKYNFFNTGRFEAYVAEGEKLRSIRDE
jgi:hypothetical protein